MLIKHHTIKASYGLMFRCSKLLDLLYLHKDVFQFRSKYHTCFGTILKDCFFGKLCEGGDNKVMTQIQPCDVMHTWHVCQPAEPHYQRLGTVTKGYITMPSGQ